MFRGMKSFNGRTGLLSATSVVLVFFCLSQFPSSAQTQARRLILKDGSYQSITKYEIHGERVRYFSAERGEWEEVPKALIDWDATDKFEQGRQDSASAPEAVDLDKEIEAERKAEQARSLVAPGLRLPDEGGIFLLDTYENQPQLAELHQSGGDVDKNAKSNILRAVINPLAGVKKNIELPEAHAKIQAHTTVPSLYINIDPSNNDPNNIDTNNNAANPVAPATVTAAAQPPLAPSPSDRFKIIRVEVKGNKRVAGAVKVAVTGKMKTDERFVGTTVTAMTGGWVKLTPTEPLTAGEYAVAEMMGKEGMNIYVWDFGVNPAAPANAFTWKPEPTVAQPKTGQPADLEKREKQ
jgi:hypothetical protein